MAFKLPIENPLKPLVNDFLFYAQPVRSLRAVHKGLNLKNGLVPHVVLGDGVRRNLLHFDMLFILGSLNKFNLCRELLDIFQLKGEHFEVVFVLLGHFRFVLQFLDFGDVLVDFAYLFGR